MEIKIGQKVKHRLSHQEMIVVDTGLIGVRLPGLETAIINQTEVEEVDEKEKKDEGTSGDPL